jgi:hypothetical protein
MVDNPISIDFRRIFQFHNAAIVFFFGNATAQRSNGRPERFTDEVEC